MITAPITANGTAMSFRNFRVSLLAGWALLACAAAAYAASRHLPAQIALPIALAFLTEYSFYLLPGFAGVCDYIARRFTKVQIATGISFTALLPYLIVAIPTGSFGPKPFLTLAAIMTAVAFWYVAPLPSKTANAARDLAFLALLAIAILSGILRWIFPAPFPKLPLDVLGHITLIRCAILASILIRGVAGADFGFIPRPREFVIGGGWFLAGTALALPLGFYLGQFRFVPRSPNVWQSLGLVLGVFWVVALSEEFFFRALLQQWLIRWTRSTAAGLILTALLFGACHLRFAGVFPNWRFALLAAILGLFYGLAFLQARSIRASMVTHTLAVGAWKLFLT